MFVGPLFLVGRPRSGTKLLRALLNRHPEISIPFWESNFIPNLSSKAESFGNLKNRRNFHRFFRFFSQIEFFRMIGKEHRYAHIVNEEFWYDAVNDFSYAGVIETFYTMYAQCDGKTIWGDLERVARDEGLTHAGDDLNVSIIMPPKPKHSRKSKEKSGCLSMLLLLGVIACLIWWV